MEIDQKKIDHVLMRNKRDKHSLIPILQDIQEEYNWLPREALEIIAQKLDISLMDIYGVATFYRTFSLKPRGKHTLHVCLGTACHVRGGSRVLKGISQMLGIKSGDTTEDRNFTLETLRCVGCCSLAPVVRVDANDVYGYNTVDKAREIVEKYREEE